MATLRKALFISICVGTIAALGTAAVRADDDLESFADLYTPDGLTLRAGATHERHRTADTLRRLVAAHEHDPSDDAATIRLAVFEARAGSEKQALDLLATIGAVSSFRALALYDTGLLRLAKGEVANARTAFADAAAVGSDAEPAIALGIACLRTGDKRGAADAFAEAEKRTSGALAASCALRVGRLEESLGELDAAAQAYERASAPRVDPAAGVVPALAPPSGAAWADEGRALLRLGRAAEAAAAYEKALQAKDDPEVRFHYGLALALSGKPVDKEVEALAQGHPDLSRKLAEIAARGGH